MPRGYNRRAHAQTGMVIQMTTNEVISAYIHDEVTVHRSAGERQMLRDERQKLQVAVNRTDADGNTAAHVKRQLNEAVRVAKMYGVLPGNDGGATCERCGTDVRNNRCSDTTCPFSDHQQTCERGWSGHPDRDPSPLADHIALPCTCVTATPQSRDT